MKYFYFGVQLLAGLSLADVSFTGPKGEAMKVVATPSIVALYADTELRRSVDRHVYSKRLDSLYGLSPNDTDNLRDISEAIETIRRRTPVNEKALADTLRLQSKLLMKAEDGGEAVLDGSVHRELTNEDSIAIRTLLYAFEPTYYDWEYERVFSITFDYQVSTKFHYPSVPDFGTYLVAKPDCGAGYEHFYTSGSLESLIDRMQESRGIWDMVEMSIENTKPTHYYVMTSRGSESFEKIGDSSLLTQRGFLCFRKL